jgi:DNA-binding NtrC family response regulator
MPEPVERILVVNNEIEFINTIKRHLKRRGFSVEISQDGDDARRIIQNSYHLGDGEPFDLVITDVMMPNINGIELLKWIKKMHPDISVILLSGFGDIDAIIENFRPEIDTYGQKPIRPDEMLQLIEQVNHYRRQSDLKRYKS